MAGTDRAGTDRAGRARTRSARGRPSAEEVIERRGSVLSATAELLAEVGYRGATTAAIADRAGVSKESLYSWFGDKNALLGALVEANAARVNERIAVGLARGDDVAATLEAFAVELLGLLSSETSLAINRAAVAELPGSSVLAEALLRHGRHATGALVEDYLRACMDRAALPVADPAEAFGLLYGLVMQDVQIRVLLGEARPADAEIARRAALAVRRFVVLLDAAAGS